MDSVEVTILGGGQEVGRAAYLVKVGEKRVLLDYGINFDENERPVFPELVAPRDLDLVIVSHAHLDHVGAVPLLFTSIRPTCYTTKVTKELARILIEDFLKLSGYYSYYGHTELQEFMEGAKTIDYRESVEVDGIKFTFYDAGHIPGSAITVLEIDGVKIAYTGDIYVKPTRLLKGADLSNLEADVLIIESTYGKLDHPNRSDVEKIFIDDVREVVDKGGIVLVPSFSVGRSQEILSLLYEKAPDIDVVIDGMVKTVTETLLKEEYKKYLRDPEGLRKAYENAKVIRGWGDRRKAWKGRGVIIASAGMLRGGPALYYARKLQSEPRAAIFLVSFQAPGTPGRRVLEKGVIDEDGPMVKARVQWYDFSSHSGKSDLLEVVKKTKNVKKVIVVHGEVDTANYFANLVEEKVGVPAVAPDVGETVRVEI